MDNAEKGPEAETPKLEVRLPEKWRYSGGRYPEVIEYLGKAYDLRDTEVASGNAIYRMTNENRVNRPEPSYIFVDHDGYVVKELND